MESVMIVPFTSAMIVSKVRAPDPITATILARVLAIIMKLRFHD